MTNRFLFVVLLLFSFSACSPAKQAENMSVPTRTEEPQFDKDFWRCVDGSTAAIPLTKMLYTHFNPDGMPPDEVVIHNQTSAAYRNLLDKKAKIIFVTEPSPEDLEMFEDAGIGFEMIPVVKEAFVLFVHHKNPVMSMTVEQLRGIYQGTIINWKEVGGDDYSIMPYQRNEASGSQTLFRSLLMKGSPIIEPKSEYVFANMSSILDAMSEDEYGIAGLGYSVYFYASSMHGNKHLRFIEVDGVPPNNDTIAGGDYPLSSHYYAIIRDDTPHDDPVRKLIEFIVTDDGQKLLQDTGYVPLRVLE